MKNNVWLVAALLLILTKNVSGLSQDVIDSTSLCGTYTTKPSCAANKYCNWFDAGSECTIRVRCEQASTAAQCNALSTDICVWSLGNCLEKCYFSLCNPMECGMRNTPIGTWCVDLRLPAEDTMCIGGTWDIGRRKCVCTGGHTGTQCEECEGPYDGGPFGKCSTCFGDNSTGTCEDCDATSCSSAATSFSNGNLTHPGCQCGCLPQYTGAKCDACAGGKAGFPNCVNCDNLHCSGLSQTPPVVIGNSCVCDCPPQYGGSQCEQCAPGRFNHPTCSQCDDDYCNQKSASAPQVVSDSCVCDCQTSFAGLQCERCDNGYNYPACADCDQAFCSNNAKSTPIMHPITQVCDCDCNNGIGGSRCERCSFNRINYPTCTKCTTQVHCSANAILAVASSPTECLCLCKEGFTGAACDSCDVGYKNYPACDPDCTVAIFCHGNAVSAVRPTTNTCDCDCFPKYEGNRCEKCKSDLVYWPTCRECDITMDCAGKASAVTPITNQTGCSCVCDNQWDPLTNCSTCPSTFGGIHCDQCAAGYFGTPPLCTKCDSNVHCNSRSVSVSVNSMNTGCSCMCIFGWNGDSCENCPSVYNKTTCASCSSENVSPYPDCLPLATAVVAVTMSPPSLAPEGCDVSVCDSNQTAFVNNVTCECTCKPQYAGLLCDVNCGSECLNGGVRLTNGTSVCRCECTSEWTGLNCEIPPKIVKLNPVNVFAGAAAIPQEVASVNIGSTSGARLKVISALCGAEDDILDPEIAPLKFKIGSSDHAIYIGGIVGDIIVMVSPILIHFIAVLMRMRSTAAHERSFKIACADMRFPYLSLFFVIFMYHGMATCGLKLSIFGSAGGKSIGISSLFIFNFGFLALIGVQNRRLIGEVKFHKKENVTMLSRYFFGPGEWVSASKSRRVHRWGLLFEMYRPGFTWFLIFECMILLVITVVQVIEADRMPVCRNLAVLLSAMFSLFALVILIFHPWASSFDNQGNFLILSLEAIACGFLARGFETGDRSHWGFDYSEQLLLIVSYITVIKGFIDPLLLLYVEWSRRSVVQTDFNIARDEHKPHELATFETPFGDDVMEDSFMYYAQNECNDPSDWKSVESQISDPRIGVGYPPSIQARKLSSDTFSIRSPLSATRSSLLNINTTTSGGTQRLCSYPLLERLKEVEISL